LHLVRRRRRVHSDGFEQHEGSSVSLQVDVAYGASLAYGLDFILNTDV